MSRKEEYKEKNLLYLDEIASEEGIRTLPCKMNTGRKNE